MNAFYLLITLVTGEVIQDETLWSYDQCNALASGAQAILVTHVDGQPVDPFEVEIAEAECVQVGASRKVQA